MVKQFFGEDYEVDEMRIIFFSYCFDRDDDDDDEVDYNPDQKAYIQKGGKIDWVRMSQYFGVDLADYDYDDGFGSQEFGGWITFKNSNKWLARHEYDGSECWSVEYKPTLKDEQ